MKHIPKFVCSEVPVVKAQNVIVGDCIETMQHMAKGSVEIIVTSPPYNSGIKYRSYGDSLSPEAYLDWMDQVATECARVLATEGSLFLNVASSAKNPYRKNEILKVFSTRFALQNEIIWVKSLAVDGVSRGHSRPLNSPRYLTQTHEAVFHLTKSGACPIDRLAIGVPYADKSNLKRWRAAEGRDLRCAGNVWFIPYDTQSRAAGNNDIRHPAVFPVEVPLRCIRLHGRGGLVLDPFSGSGTTLVAARQLGHPAIGIEIDHEYARVARERIASFEAQASTDRM